MYTVFTNRIFKYVRNVSCTTRKGVIAGYMFLMTDVSGEVSIERMDFNSPT